jgi:trans-2-enoyl-CoA reductase
MNMLKAQYDRRGPVPQDVIRAMPLELPPPAAGQVLVAMLASPINPSNLLTLTGEYGVLPPLPAIGGSEGVGRIAALGDGEDIARRVSEATGGAAIRLGIDAVGGAAG